jgi:hypothetical protein
MPRRNRVTPLGELIAVPERGLVFGNRGCLHDPAGRIRRHHSGRRWIACRLRFKGRRRTPLLAPGRYSELFFLDDATALAAGHRPCAECRRADYAHLSRLWAELHPGRSGADAIDARLHDERLTPDGHRRLHAAPFESLPDGVFVLDQDRPRLLLGGHLLGWSAAGYAARSARPRGGEARVITPPSLIALLASGWTPLVPLLHPSARGGEAQPLSPARAS